mmetsp:Transcript_1422/g.3190  ORF Transcript_1422/g.3190 Transcript_1422/m.3190 type:complete len:100 (+) Transcript_1422:3-302(+)
MKNFESCRGSLRFIMGMYPKRLREFIRDQQELRFPVLTPIASDETTATVDPNEVNAAIDSAICSSSDFAGTEAFRKPESLVLDSSTSLLELFIEIVTVI